MDHLDRQERAAAEVGLGRDLDRPLALVHRYESACYRRMERAVKLLGRSDRPASAKVAQPSYPLARSVPPRPRSPPPIIPRRRRWPSSRPPPPNRNSSRTAAPDALASPGPVAAREAAFRPPLPSRTPKLDRPDLADDRPTPRPSCPRSIDGEMRDFRPKSAAIRGRKGSDSHPARPTCLNLGTRRGTNPSCQSVGCQLPRVGPRRACETGHPRVSEKNRRVSHALRGPIPDRLITEN